jgi:aryl-alcohol dehydrogenase-like predicted oxidoreductase
MGIGTRFWGYGDEGEDHDRRAAFDTALEAGVTLFDTAEIYAFGKSERLLGSFIQNRGSSAVIMTKYAPFPWRFGRNNIVNALRSSLQRLGLEQVHLYMVHWPYTLTSIETLMVGLADAVDAGLTNMLQLQPLIRLMQEIGKGHGGKTVGQVALNWTIAKGALPIPGAKNARQAEENIGTLGWSLTDEEVAGLDADILKL